MHEPDDICDTARQMIIVHGLHAPGIAQERVAEMRARHDGAALERWRSIYAMICDLKRAARRRTPYPMKGHSFTSSITFTSSEVSGPG